MTWAVVFPPFRQFTPLLMPEEELTYYVGSSQLSSSSTSSSSSSSSSSLVSAAHSCGSSANRLNLGHSGCNYASIVTDAFPCQLISRSREQGGDYLLISAIALSGHKLEPATSARGNDHLSTLVLSHARYLLSSKKLLPNAAYASIESN